MHHIRMCPSYEFIGHLNRVDTTPQVGDSVEIYDHPAGSPASGVVLSAEAGMLRILYPDGGEDKIDLYDCAVEDRPSLRELWERALKDGTPDGVAWTDEGPSPALHARLQAGVDALASGAPDYHPGSGTMVRDLVHPSLYPHIADTAPEGPAQDRWGRPFESSRFQWLPTSFAVSAGGAVDIQGEINRLPRAANEPLYGALAELFSEMLPLFESVYGYAEGTQFFVDNDEYESSLPNAPLPEADIPTPRALRGRTLQVITKIVEYRLRPGETFEGVWHVEGMSHEHIVATGVHILSRDAALEGGTLRFKRAYTREEAGLLFWRIPQDRPQTVERMVEEGTIPLGSLETPAGRLLVFPNSHIHKLTAMSAEVEATRRVIVFWLVDPEQTIPGAADVPRPQDRMSHAEALAARLALMEERRLHKQSLNVRAVSLCEH